MFLQIIIDLVSQEESFAKIHVLTFGKYIYIYIFFYNMGWKASFREIDEILFQWWKSFFFFFLIKVMLWTDFIALMVLVDFNHVWIKKSIFQVNSKAATETY